MSANVKKIILAGCFFLQMKIEPCGKCEAAV